MNKDLIYILNINVNYNAVVCEDKTYRVMDGLTVDYIYKNITASININSSILLDEDGIKERIIEESA